jgi:hypothetical protein
LQPPSCGIDARLASLLLAPQTFSRPSSIPTIVNVTKMTAQHYAQSGDVVSNSFDLHVTNPLNASLATIVRGVQQLKLNEKSRITYHTIEYPT